MPPETVQRQAKGDRYAARADTIMYSGSVSRGCSRSFIQSINQSIDQLRKWRTDGQTDGQTGGQTDGQTDRQTERADRGSFIHSLETVRRRAKLICGQVREQRCSLRQSVRGGRVPPETVRRQATGGD